MPKFLVTFFLLHVLLGCAGKTENKSTFDRTNFKEHFLEEVKGTLLLPPRYQQITNENKRYHLRKLDSTSIVSEAIDYLESERLDYVLFVKEDDSNDVVIIHKTNHINFSKREANRFLGMLESSMRANYAHVGYTRLQNKMTRTERSKYIKVKYMINFPQGNIFRTNYVVTSNISTFAILEIRKGKVDFEDLIRRINYTVN